MSVITIAFLRAFKHGSPQEAVSQTIGRESFLEYPIFMKIAEGFLKRFLADNEMVFGICQDFP